MNGKRLTVMPFRVHKPNGTSLARIGSVVIAAPVTIAPKAWVGPCPLRKQVQKQKSVQNQERQ